MHMSRAITRRTFATSLGATAALPLMGRVGAQESTPSGSFSVNEQQATSDEPTGYLGMDRASLEAALGQTGTPAGDQVIYVSPTDNVTPMTVGFTDDIVTFVEFDFSGAGEQGIPRDQALSAVAVALPPDAAVIESFGVMPNQSHTSVYALDVYEAGNLGTAMALLQTANTGVNPDPAQYTHVLTASIASASESDLEVTPTGTPGGIGISKADWVAAYGEPEEANAEKEFYPGVIEQGMDVTVFYMPQADTIQRLDFTADNADMKAITEAKAAETAGNSIPADSQVVDNVTFPATEQGPLIVRAMRWSSAEVATTLNYEGSILVLIFEKIDDPKPMAKRMVIGLNTEQFIDQ